MIGKTLLKRTLLLTGTALSFVASSLAAPNLPAGFVLTQITNNLQAPTSITFAPDGRMFISLKSGVLRIIKDGKLLPDPFLTVDTSAAGEHGLIGVAFDPAFVTNGYVYVYYVAKTPTIHSRVSRFTANGDVALPGETPIIDLDDRGKSIFHVAGGIHFGPDGKLYIASGDNAGAPFTNNSQRLTNTHGKILRINSDGSTPSDNPFVSTTTGPSQSIWAYGLRNPFSFSFERSTGRLFINDVGQASWEEINEGSAGANYGWPLAEGMSINPALKNPIFTYAHGSYGDDTVGCAITGGTFYDPIVPQFPQIFQGKYFFIDYCNNWIHVFDPITGVASAFGQNITSSGLQMVTGPDGSLYFLSQWFSNIYRLSFTGTQDPQFITQPQDLAVSLGNTASFSVNVSGASPLTYQWQRNGVNIPDATSPTYSFVTSVTDGGALFSCVVSNSFGTTTSRSAKLSVIFTQPPLASIDYPIPGALYNAGDRIFFGGSGIDPTTGILLPSAFRWDVEFHHLIHFHPFITNLTGTTAGYFDTPTLGETSDQTWFRILLTVTNPAGQSTTVSQDIFPNRSIFFLRSNPPGLQITLDGQPMDTPQYVYGVTGFTRTLGVVSPQTLNGIPYEFSSWSDGKSMTHNFKTSVSKRTYTANFRPVGAARDGTLVATPNPTLVCDGSGAGSTTLVWNTTGTTATQIRINAPNGNRLSSSTTSTGSVTTGKWIGDGSTFYLQNTSGGLPLTAENTLATVTVNLTSYGCDSLKKRAQKNRRVTASQN